MLLTLWLFVWLSLTFVTLMSKANTLYPFLWKLWRVRIIKCCTVKIHMETKYKKPIFSQVRNKLNNKNKHYTHYHVFDTHYNTHTNIIFLCFKSSVKIKRGFFLLILILFKLRPWRDRCQYIIWRKLILKLKNNLVI